MGCLQYLQDPQLLEWIDFQYFQDPGLLEWIVFQYFQDPGLLEWIVSNISKIIAKYIYCR